MVRKLARLDGRIECDPVQTSTFYTVTWRYRPIKLSLFDIPPGSIMQVTTTSEHSATRLPPWRNTYAFKIDATGHVRHETHMMRLTLHDRIGTQEAS